MKKRIVQIVFEGMPLDRAVTSTELAEMTGLKRTQAASSLEGLNRRGYVTRISKGTYRREPGAVFKVKELREPRSRFGFAESMQETYREVTEKGKAWSANCTGPECASVTRKPQAVLCQPCNAVAFPAQSDYIPFPPASVLR